MTMKLIEKKNGIDENFKPTIRITVEVDVEAIMDDISMFGEAEMQRVVGAEFFNLLMGNKSE